MDIKKILLATDGSEESEKALDYSVYLAGIMGTSVTAVYVSEIHFPLTSLFPMYEDEILKIASKREDSFKERFREISEDLKQKGIPFSSEVLRDGTVEGITKTAEREGADLIVMGKSGLGFIEESIIGSNTIKVLREAEVPVLAVRRGNEIEKTGIKKIVVPVDISDDSVSPVYEALSLADSLGAEVIAVYVFWLDSTAYDIPPRVVSELIESSKDELSKQVQDELGAYLKTNGRSAVKLSSEVIHGVSPSMLIKQYAKDNHADLIVVKTHGRKGISRLLYGSETERIIRESPCPVLAVK